MHVLVQKDSAFLTSSQVLPTLPVCRTSLEEQGVCPREQWQWPGPRGGREGGEKWTNPRYIFKVDAPNLAVDQM
jgi:hypothetical protein